MKKADKRKLKGFTLVEVMTSLVIMTILVAVASGVIIVTFDIFARSALRRAAQNNGNNVYEYIYDHISYATALKIGESVDINNEGVVSSEGKESVSGWLGEDKLSKIETAPEDGAEGTDEGDYKVNTYYELLSADKEKMTIQRKGVSEPVFIYGKKLKNESGEDNGIGNTMNGCQCIITFDKYDKPEDVSLRADTIGFSVTIRRDDEVFYERHGNIPILNKELKEHIEISESASDEFKDLNIFYTYIW